MATWKLDNDHTSVEFSIMHLGVAWVKGHFTEVAGTISGDLSEPEKASVEATIKAASISTTNEKRDRHLRSEDFFAVDSHPDITFSSTEIEKSEEDRFQVKGSLTMRGISRPVTLDVQKHRVREVPLQDGGSETRAGFTATATVNRHDYGISWDAPAGEGESTVGGSVKVTIEGEAIKQE